MDTKKLTHIKSLKKRYEKKWLAIPAVKAIGIGMLKSGETGLIVSVDKYNDDLRREIPYLLEGVGIEIQESGPFKAL